MQHPGAKLLVSWCRKDREACLSSSPKQHTGGPLYAETHRMPCVHWHLTLTLSARACVKLNHIQRR